MKLSKQIEKMLADVVHVCKSETQKAAIEELADELEQAVDLNPCLRCARAGHLIYWNDEPPDVKKHAWRLVQVKCADFRSLPQGPFGFDMAGAQFVCDGEEAAVGAGGFGGDHDRYQAQAGSSLSARGEQERPEHPRARSDSDRRGAGHG